MTDSNQRGPDGKFLPGNCANPAGRPRRGAALAECLRGRLAQEVTLSTGEKTTVGQAIANRLVVLALGGDVAGLRLLFERVEGRAPLALDLLDVEEVRIIRLPLAPPAEQGERGGTDGD